MTNADTPNTANTPNPPDAASPAPQPAPRRRRRWPVIAGIGFFVLLILGSGSFVVASALEDQDSFCISCHTVPETTYYNRAYMALDNTSAAVPDLATAHYLLSQEHGKPAFACIDCHRGDASLGNRIATIALGGRDMVIYVLGRADPTIEKTQIAEGWLPNNSCIGCHTDTLLRQAGLDNHYHNYLPQTAALLANGATPEAATATNGSNGANGGRFNSRAFRTINVNLNCTDCHLAHTTLINGATTMFVNTSAVAIQCVECHKIAHEGPQNASQIQ